MESNYDKQVEFSRSLFLTYDQREMIERYDLEHDGTYLYLTFVGDRYRIGRADGRVERMEPDGTSVPCRDYNVVMTLYDALCYPQGRPELAHEWCPLYALQVTMSSPSADLFNKKYEQRFTGRPEALRRACGRLGGKQPEEPAAGADVCWQFAVFPFLPVQLRFWDADEEFPAQLRFLWDRNTLKFLHFETVYYVIGHLLGKLAAEDGKETGESA